MTKQWVQLQWDPVTKTHYAIPDNGKGKGADAKGKSKGKGRRALGPSALGSAAVCDYCGKANHTSDVCRSKIADHATCPRCGFTGHAASACPHIHNVCGNCGKTGHTKHACHAESKTAAKKAPAPNVPGLEEGPRVWMCNPCGIFYGDSANQCSDCKARRPKEDVAATVNLQLKQAGTEVTKR